MAAQPPPAPASQLKWLTLTGLYQIFPPVYLITSILLWDRWSVIQIEFLFSHNYHLDVQFNRIQKSQGLLIYDTCFCRGGGLISANYQLYPAPKYYYINLFGKKINNCISQLSGTFCFMESTTGLQRPVSVDTINAGLCFFLLKKQQQQKNPTMIG